MFQKITWIAALALAACSAPPDRLALTPLTSQLELRPLVRSAMLRTVSLPTYAAVEEVAFQDASGLIVSNDDVLWADDPQRAVTLVLSRNLSDILNIGVGPEPWPFVELADVAIDVRVERMLAGSDGTFRLAGQYYVGGDGIAFRNSSHAFSIETPMTGGDLGSIATAQAQALLTLSEQIARTLAR